MTGSKVLIVKLPELHADVKALEAFRAYVCDALGAGALVLPLGTTYAVEDFPALGAVEVVARSAVPVVIGGSRPTPAGGGAGLVVGGRVVRSVPDSGTAPEPERAEVPSETPKPQPDAPAKPAPILRSPPVRSGAPRSHALPMSESEIVASYRQAAKPAAQITVLADLNACSKERIEEILREAGEPLPKKRGRQKQTEGVK
nr:MAG TPA: hypothetical protein [Caudoviricetes sp.]